MAKLHKGILITVMATATAMLGGCDREATGSWRVCSDKNGQRLPDLDCSTSHGSSGGSWLYYSKSKSVPKVGEWGDGGTRTPEPGIKYAPAPERGITRGGFGGIGEGHSGRVGA